MNQDSQMADVLESTADNSVSVKATMRCGKGCFALTDVKAGGRVLVEKCHMWIHEYEDAIDTLNELIRHFEELSNEDQKRYLSLYPRLRPDRITQLHRILSGPLSDGTQLAPDEIDTYIRVELIYQTNAFEMGGRKLNEDGTIARPISGVFLTASRLNHCCDPNLSYSTHMKPGFIVCTAAKDIKKGDELTISYNPYGTRHDRREWLRTDYDIACRCSVCRPQRDQNGNIVPPRSGWFDGDAMEANRLEVQFSQNGAWMPQDLKRFREDLEDRDRVLSSLEWRANHFFS